MIHAIHCMQKQRTCVNSMLACCGWYKVRRRLLSAQRHQVAWYSYTRILCSGGSQCAEDADSMSNSSVPASVSGAGVIKSSDSVGLNRYADADICWYSNSFFLQGPFAHPMA